MQAQDAEDAHDLHVQGLRSFTHSAQFLVLSSKGTENQGLSW